MARRSRRGLAAFLIAVLAAACGPGPSGSDRSPSTTTSSQPPSTTSTSTSSSHTTTTIEVHDVDAEVLVPEGEGPFPTVVLVHGGGWVTGNPEIMVPLADFLNANGFLAVNTEYELATLKRASFPQAVDDVACAVRFAASLPESNGNVTVIGHSAGAHLGALVALTGDAYKDGCPFGGTGVPDRFIGLAGPYDVSHLGLAVAAFFGGGPDRLPDEWRAGNPQLLTDENPGLVSLIMYGSEDGLVSERFAIDFYEALSASGSETSLEMVEGAHHNEMHDPDVVGDLIVTWLER